MTTRTQLTFLQYMQQELESIYTPSEISVLSRMILGDIPDVTPAMLTTCKINHLSQLHRGKIEEIVDRLKTGEPIQYVLRKTEFYGLMFHVTPDVLIPRPETEELVEWVLNEAGTHKLKLLDIGTGSGCIAVTLAKKLPGSDVSACDVSEKALEVAALNARANQVSVHCFHQDVFDAFTGTPPYDVVISNPPYVLESEKKEMEDNVLKFEPPQALFVPDESPLLFYERIADLALEILPTGGKLYFEIHQSKAKEVKAMLQSKGYMNVQVKNDIAGNARMVRAVRVPTA